jgi:peptide/nickel transport system permease protein
MAIFVLRRFIQLIPTVFLISLVVFVMARKMPGDPAILKMGVAATLPENRENVERLREKMGLKEPMAVQYAIWLKDVLRGDLGNSYWSGRTVVSLIAGRLPATIQLMLTTVILSLIISLPVSIIAALKRGSLFDKGLMLFSIAGLAVPIFWLGLALILFFAVRMQLLPASGHVPFFEDPVESIRRSILPAVVLSTREVAIYTKFLRAEMIEILNEDYIRVARAKGLAMRMVVLRHALKNAFIPFVTVVGLQIGALISGVVIVEQVFSWSGIGWLAMQAVLQRDYTMVQGIVLFVAALYVMINLLVDIGYAWLDPRVRESMAGART